MYKNQDHTVGQWGKEGSMILTQDTQELSLLRGPRKLGVNQHKDHA